MRKWIGVWMVAVATGGLFAAKVEAQVFTPTYMAPRQSSDVGLYLSDGPGEFSIEGILRRNFGSYDLGFRAGLADTQDLTLLVGGEIRHPISPETPVDLAVTGHAQGAFGDGTAAGFLVGLSLGYTFTEPAISFTPYLHPRVGAVGYGDGLDLELLADLGFDVQLSQSLDIRFGLAFADRHGADFGIGLAWR